MAQSDNDHIPLPRCTHRALRVHIRDDRLPPKTEHLLGESMDDGMARSGSAVLHSRARQLADLEEEE